MMALNLFVILVSLIMFILLLKKKEVPFWLFFVVSLGYIPNLSIVSASGIEMLHELAVLLLGMVSVSSIWVIFYNIFKKGKL